MTSHGHTNGVAETHEKDDCPYGDADGISVTVMCLVGTGNIGKVHFKNLRANPRVSLKYVVDVDVKAAEAFAAKVANCTPLAALDKALADPEVEAVVIAAPTAFHKDMILQSVRAGKAVLCEKPISLKWQDIDECYEEAKKHNVPLLSGYQRRHDPSFVKLAKYIQSGAIGHVRMVKTISRDHPQPSIRYLKTSGGIFHDCGCHDIDLCLWLLQEDPVEVHVMANAFDPEIKAIGDYDTVLITLKTASGKLASIDLSRQAAYGYDQRIEVLGDSGMVQAMNQQPTSTILATGNGFETDKTCHSFHERYERGYAMELDHFLDIVQHNVQPRHAHSDARKIAIIADACGESARTGKQVTITY